MLPKRGTTCPWAFLKIFLPSFVLRRWWCSWYMFFSFVNNSFSFGSHLSLQAEHARHADSRRMRCKAGTAHRSCGRQYSGTVLTHFAVNHKKKFDLKNAATDNAPIELRDVTGRWACAISFSPGFSIEVSSQASLCFLKQPVCHTGVSLHNGSHLVSHAQFLELNCYNEVTCTTEFFVDPVETCSSAQDRPPPRELQLLQPCFAVLETST